MKSFLLIFLLATPMIARADMPPPDGYVEQCTVAKQTVAGLECKECSVSHEDVQACSKTLGTQGFRKMCKSWGASAWSEVWCKGEPTAPAETKPAETPTEAPKKTGCEGGESAPWALALLAVVLGRGAVGPRTFGARRTK